MYHSNVCFPILRSPVTHPMDVPEVLAYPIRGCFPPPSNAVLFFLYHDSFLVPFRAAACLTDQTAAASAVYLKYCFNITPELFRYYHRRVSKRFWRHSLSRPNASRSQGRQTAGCPAGRTLCTDSFSKDFNCIDRVLTAFI